MTSKTQKKAHRREKREKKKDEPTAFEQQGTRGGLLVTAELDKALEECKSRVAEIAEDCRKKNRRFRDIEFDLENDKQRCLAGITPNPEETYEPSDVRRIYQIFDKPSFFIGGADSNDIVQGGLGDCWFLSALSTMSTAKGLIERFCVARDEQVGVYGFIFFRDASWHVVIIDDLLYTSIPKFEELSAAEKHLYHNNKEQYNLRARKGGQSLYFAKSGTQGETWVPLIEKAYAKLHGNYGALSGGEAGEAIEDLTGGVTSVISTKDILDPDRFWKEELLRANQDRLFGCAFDALDGSRTGGDNPSVNGLFGSHAYSVLRAVEVRGKRFVVIRNPWGASEWTGPWSDGAKEWTPEWLSALPEIGHVFGDDGEFVMEFSDFLSNWEQIDRTLLFDSTWVMSSQWLRVIPRPLTLAWSYGDISFALSVPGPTPAVIVLSKLDERYFEEISSPSTWNFDFIVYKKGEKKPYAMTSYSRFYSRSINLETHLDAGDYVVHVRLDRNQIRPPGYTAELIENWNARNASRVLTEKYKGQSIAANFEADANAGYIPLPLDVLAGSDLAELEAQLIAKAEAEAKQKKEEAEQKKAKKEQEKAEKKAAGATEEVPNEDDEEDEANDAGDGGKDVGTQTETDSDDSSYKPGSKDEESSSDDDEDHDGDSLDGEGSESSADSDSSHQAEDGGEAGTPGASEQDIDEGDTIVLGLRVYTKSDAPVVVNGQLRNAPPSAFRVLSEKKA